MWFDSPRGFKPVFRFNDESGELRANGASVWLTERESQVFLELLRRPGEITDHGTLLEAIWGTRDLEDNHAIQVYISRIRKKAADLDGKGTWIRPIRGRGYIFHERDALLVRIAYDADLIVTSITPSDRFFLGWNPAEVIGTFFLLADGEIPRDNQPQAIEAVQLLHAMGILDTDSTLALKNGDGGTSRHRVQMKSRGPKTDFRGLDAIIHL